MSDNSTESRDDLASDGESVERPDVQFGRDRSFWGLTVSQFLGAFNDNLFKQLVLLLCVDFTIAQAASESAGKNISTAETGDQYQGIATLVFALPWVLFSGIAGFTSDRISKRTGIVLFKSMEIVVMLAGMLAFLSGQLWPLFVVLFLMSTQSSFFGPNKYGVLPELFHDRDLPAINGLFQMTTFVAIIFGMAAAGFAKDAADEASRGQAALAIVSGLCVLVAIAGSATSLLVRRVPPAQPEARFTTRTLGVDPDNWKLLRSDRFLMGVLLATCVFWFSGAVVQQGVNGFGKRELGLSDSGTSLLLACLAIGIAIGCVLAGRLSQERIRFRLVSAGSWGLAVGFGLLVLLAVVHNQIDGGTRQMLHDPWLLGSRIEWLGRAIMFGIGVSAGAFVVPLQVVLQVVPPDEQKGRMIGTMNLFNWLGIFLSGAFFGLFEALRGALNQTFSLKILPSSVFVTLAVVFAAMALLYRPADRELE